MNSFFEISRYARVLEIKNSFVCAYDYDTSLYSDGMFDELEIPFPHTLNRAVIKRKCEYLVGRFVAKEALKSMGFTVKGIASGLNREPIWPQGIVASITHTEKTALCLASHDTHLAYLGVDLENILTTDLTKKLKNIVVNPDEENYLRRIPIDFATLFTLVFSIKESIFKALHPFVLRYFDFSAARLIHLSLDKREFKFVITENLCDSYPKGSIVSGCFYFNDYQVLSAVYKHIQ